METWPEALMNVPVGLYRLHASSLNEAHASYIAYRDHEESVG